MSQKYRVQQLIRLPPISDGRTRFTGIYEVTSLMPANQTVGTGLDASIKCGCRVAEQCSRPSG